MPKNTRILEIRYYCIIIGRVEEKEKWMDGRKGRMDGWKYESMKEVASLLSPNPNIDNYLV